MTMAKVPHQKSNDPSNIYVPASNGVPIRSREMGYSQIEDLKELLAAGPCGFEHMVDLGGADFTTPGIVLAKCLKCGAEFSFPSPLKDPPSLLVNERQIGLTDMQTDLLERLTMSIKAMKVLNAKKTFTPKQTRCVRHKTKGCTSVLCR